MLEAGNGCAAQMRADADDHQKIGVIWVRPVPRLEHRALVMSVGQMKGDGTHRSFAEQFYSLVT